jgi:hypothetical protein
MAGREKAKLAIRHVCADESQVSGQLYLSLSKPCTAPEPEKAQTDIVRAAVAICHPLPGAYRLLGHADTCQALCQPQPPHAPSQDVCVSRA